LALTRAPKGIFLPDEANSLTKTGHSIRYLSC
jgi:hypothetical protein